MVYAISVVAELLVCLLERDKQHLNFEELGKLTKIVHAYAQ